jgi:DNA-nicking Smr family endonuclease
MHWTVQDEADLHGLTADEASRALDDFILEARGHGLRCVRVIHGKGMGVLRERARRDLALRTDVVAYVEAPAAQGGSGAVLVLLDG